MNHLNFKLGHPRQELIFVVIHNIGALMTIHINSFFNECVLPSQLNQPSLSSPDSKGFLWFDAELWENHVVDVLLQSTGCHLPSWEVLQIVKDHLLDTLIM